MSGDEKEVFFYLYCNTCDHKDTPEVEDPCNECLTYGFNFNSHKPRNYIYTEKD